MSNRRALLPIFLIVLVDVFGLTMVIPLQAPYAEHFEASPLQCTLLVTVYAFFQLISGPLLGRISDRVGRKPLLAASQAGSLIGFLVMASAQTLPLVYLARMIDGATAGNLSLAQAYISDNTAPEDRAKSFAVIGIAFGTGFFLGPAVTGLLVKHHGLRAPIYAAALFSLCSMLCTLAFLPHQKPAPRPEGAEAGPGGKRLSILSWGAYVQYFRRPVLSGLLWQFFIYVFAFFLFTSGFSLFAERVFSWHGRAFDAADISYVFAYAGFLGIVLQGGLIGRLVKRFGESNLIFTGSVALVLAYLGLGAIHTVPLLLMVATVKSYGDGVMRPTLTSLITQNADRSEQGVVLGLNQSLSSVSQIASSLLSGVLIESGLLSGWAWTAAGVALVGVALCKWGSNRAHAVVAQPAA